MPESATSRAELMIKKSLQSKLNRDAKETDYWIRDSLQEFRSEYADLFSFLKSRAAQGGARIHVDGTGAGQFEIDIAEKLLPNHPIEFTSTELVESRILDQRRDLGGVYIGLADEYELEENSVDMVLDSYGALSYEKNDEILRSIVANRTASLKEGGLYCIYYDSRDHGFQLEKPIDTKPHWVLHGRMSDFF